MKIISGIRIEGFRSIKLINIENIGDFSVFAGTNNAGKSNILRALNVFFTGEVEPGEPFNLDRDFHRGLAGRGKRKKISVSVHFELPAQFNFRKGTESVRDFLGTSFVITQRWVRDDPRPFYYLDKNTTINGDVGGPDSNLYTGPELQKVQAFLAFISFRYIPNRVLPTEVIKKEHQAIRDVLVRRLASQKKNAEDVLKQLRTSAEQLIEGMAGEVTRMVPSVTGLRLSTASSLADLAFRFGYMVQEGTSEMGEDEQGSGMQSLLMFQTLQMIDMDRYQQFGWKQVSIWAVEEPESSLHLSLEAQVAGFLSAASTKAAGRLQTIATTHSELMMQYADKGYFVEKGALPKGETIIGTKIRAMPQKDLVRAASQAGISRWTTPILFHPLEPILLVEGLTEEAIFRRLARSNAWLNSCRVVTVGTLSNEPALAGTSAMRVFIEKNKEALKSRNPNAPVVALLDWEEEMEESLLKKLGKDIESFKVLRFDAKNANPDLLDSFKGVERYYPTDLVKEAAGSHGIVGKLADGQWTVLKHKQYDSFKSTALKLIEKSNDDTDFRFFKGILLTISTLLDIS